MCVEYCLRILYAHFMYTAFIKGSGTEINKTLLSDNGSGVLLSTAGARLPNRTGAGLCFKLLCVFPSDNPHMHDAPFTGLSLNCHTAHIFFRQGERA